MKKSRRKFLKSGTIAYLGTGLGLPLSYQAYLMPQELQSAAPSSFNRQQLDGQSDLRIQKIETFTLSYQTVVRVTADDGTTGFGQVANYNNDITATVLHRMVAWHYLGKDPYRPEALTNAAIEANYKFPWSFVSRAAAGVETALWDLRARRENKTVCELLGGTPRSFPVYASSMSREITPEAEAARMARLRDEYGFTAFKTRVGQVNGKDQDAWPGRTEAIIPAVRQAVGPDIRLLADANGCYTPAKAIEVGRMMEDEGYVQFEEPCPFWELEWTARVTQVLKMDTSGGEQDNDPAQWRRMINMRAVDIVQPDICYLGGIARTIRVAEAAAVAGLPCIPHSANLSLISIFSLHLMPAISNAGRYMEYSIEDPDWVEGIYEEPLRIKEGKVEFPEKPGWGVQIRPEWLEKADRQVSELDN